MLLTGKMPVLLCRYGHTTNALASRQARSFL